MAPTHLTSVFMVVSDFGNLGFYNAIHIFHYVHAKCGTNLFAYSI